MRNKLPRSPGCHLEQLTKMRERVSSRKPQRQRKTSAHGCAPCTSPDNSPRNTRNTRKQTRYRDFFKANKKQDTLWQAEKCFQRLIKLLSFVCFVCFVVLSGRKCRLALARNYTETSVTEKAANCERNSWPVGVAALSTPKGVTHRSPGLVATATYPGFTEKELRSSGW